MWKSRWDSLTLFTPRSTAGFRDGLPAAHDTYPSKDEAAAHPAGVCRGLRPPGAAERRVHLLARSDGRATLWRPGTRLPGEPGRGGDGSVPGAFCSSRWRGIWTLDRADHSAQYRSPAQLPEGPALVVGGGTPAIRSLRSSSGTRKVDMAVGTRMPALPQRLLGRDLFWWLSRLGVMNVSVEVTARPADGRARRAHRLEHAATAARRRHDQEAPGALRRQARRFADGSQLDVGAVVWATGYRPDYAWIEVPGSHGQRRPRPAPARGRRPLPVSSSSAFLGSTPRIGAPGLRAGGRRLHRRDHRRVGGGWSGSGLVAQAAASRRRRPGNPRPPRCRDDAPAPRLRARPRNRLERESGVRRRGRLGARRRRPSGGVAARLLVARCGDRRTQSAWR